MTTSYSNIAGDAISKIVASVQEVQAATVTAGFDLAAKLLQQQRVTALALLDAFAAAGPAPRKG